jgi:NADPH:quinone reductase-like Zn-dependent oxidoreductase
MTDSPTPVPVRPGTMKAWMLERYGSPESLKLRDVPFPAFRDDHEMLVRVYATSVNPADRHNLKPPLFLRRRGGFVRPKNPRLGLDLAGRVEVVGPSVKGFHVGDEVFGVGTGAFGEYAIADETEVAPKPSRLTFEQAAALPIAATTALQGLRDKAQVRPGQKVVINGASGGVGTFAVQIAKALGAEVHAVCNRRNVDQAKSLGADRVFDYTREDFTQSGQRYDVLFDTQLNHSLASYRRVLNPHGVLLAVGAGPGSVGRLLFRLIGKSLGARVMGPKMKFFVASVKTGTLVSLTELVDAGKLTPAIGQRFPLGQVPAALRVIIEGHARAKVVITVVPENPTAV